MQIKILLTVLGAGMIAALALAATAIVGQQSEAGQIAQLQQQHRHDQATFVQYRHELNRAGVALLQVDAKAAGTHRDLITCADLQNMGLQWYGPVNLNTDASGNITATLQQTPIQLPQHCINN